MIASCTFTANDNILGGAPGFPVSQIFRSQGLPAQFLYSGVTRSEGD